MKLACPNCQAVHDYADQRPAFCSRCGQPYPPADPDATRTLDLDATGPDLGSERHRPPPVIGGFRLLRVLGEGGMGKVYEAEEIATARRVAVKIVATANVASAEALARFRREGQLAATLTHPRCVFVLRADEDAGRPYLVLELMPGTTLRDLVLKKGPLSPGEAVQKMFDVMDGLGALHQLGIIHRDVKPANCFLEADGRVKVGDFGLARTLLGGDGSLTGTGVFVGTPLFAAPEQLKGKPVDVRADVYSVATTLYYLLSGRAPFEGSDGAGVVARIASEDPPPLRERRPDLPPALERVVLRGLARDPAKRYQNLDDFRRALYPFLPGRRLTFGGMGLRALANLADGAILFVLCSLVVLGLMPLAGVVPFAVGVALDCAFICLYFTLFEGLLGWSPGKRLLGLRVYRADAERPPGMLRAAARILALVAALNLLNGDFLGLLGVPNSQKDIFGARYILFTVYYDTQSGFIVWGNPLPKAGVPTIPASEAFRDQAEHPTPPAKPRYVPLEVGFYLVATHVGVLLLLCTMRQRNGYRGLHEFISGTHVVRLPPPPAKERFRIPPIEPADSFVAADQPELPRQLGPFEVQGVWAGSDGSDVLLGEDVSLGRRVLLVRRPLAEEGLSAARKAVSRMTRPRWLASGTTERQTWHAFVAPEKGWTLPDLLQFCPPLPWRETRLLLQQLEEELTAALGDGTLPTAVAVEQVWVQADGKLLLLDWPLHAPLPPRPSTELPDTAVMLKPLEPRKTPFGEWSPEQSALALVREVAVLALEGKPRLPFAPPAPIQARIPLHAASMMARLVGTENPYQHLAEFHSDLEATKERVAEINWVRLLVYVSVETLLVYTGVMYLPMLLLLTKERDPAPNDGCARFQAVMLLLSGLFYSLLICPPLAVLIAVLMRGGFSFYFTDTALVTRTGQPAPRWRCALRAFLTWIQIVVVTVVLWMATGYLVALLGLDKMIGDIPIEQSWGAIAFYLYVLAYALIGETLLAWLPGRSLADRICGTYLVPK